MGFYNKFLGIRYLNGNKVKSKYTNVVPCGTYVTDRDGQTISEYSVDPFRDLTTYLSKGEFDYPYQGPPVKPTTSNADTLKMRLCFRIGNGKLVKIYTFTNKPYGGECVAVEVQKSSEHPIPNEWDRLVSKLYTGDSFGDNWCWCESSTKPSQIYFSDGKHIFFVNYTELGDDKHSYRLFSLVLPTYTPTEGASGINAEVAEGNDVCFQSNVSMTIGNICWYDNKLVCVDKDLSNVWITCSDPAQFYRDAYVDVNGSIRDCGEWYDTENRINNLWVSRYRSTLSSSWLQFVYPSAGQLWFINNDNIETWTRSGNERAPLNSTCNTPFGFSAIDAKVIDSVLYVYGKNNTNQYRLIRIGSEGAVDMTNDAISDELDDSFYIDSTVLDNKLHIRLVKPLREEKKGYETGIAYAVNPATNAWCLLDDSNNTNFLRWYCGERVGFTVGGSSYLIKPNLLYLNNETHEPKSREIVEAFDVFALRKSFAMVRLQVDTDEFDMIEANTPEYVVSGDDEFDPEFKDIVLSVSNDKGNSFGTSVRRKIPKLGNGAENITWRNVGSGFSILLKFAYSCVRKILLYGIEIETR